MGQKNINSYDRQSQLPTIFILFLFSRIGSILLFDLSGSLNFNNDIRFYFETALLSEQGRIPFLNMWYEYPPGLAYLTQLIYSLVRLFLPLGEVSSPTYEAFRYTYRVVLIIFDAGVLIVMHRCAERVWGIVLANWIAWVYSMLLLPMAMNFYSHQVIPVFFTLLALYLLIQNKWAGSAAAIGCAIAAKLMPVFFIGGVVSALRGRKRVLAAYLGVTFVVVFLAYSLFLAAGSAAWVAASFVAYSGVASYSTPWALLDGNWGTGNYGRLYERLDINRAAHLPGNPAVIPTWVSLLVFGVLLVWLVLKRVPENALSIVWMATLFNILFRLLLKGWSMQYALALIPFLLLSFPDRRGIALIIGLTIFSYHKWPLGEAFSPPELIMFAILMRTLLLLTAAWMLFRKLWPRETKVVL